MKQWIRKVAATPLENVAKVINSLISGDDKTTNAPSIKAVNDALATKQDLLTIDESPTQDSTNPVQSGAVYNLVVAYQQLANSFSRFVGLEAVTKSDFAIISETLTVTSAGQKMFFVNYPEGYNYQNSIIVSVDQNEISGNPIFYAGTSSGIVLNVNIAYDVAASIPVKIMLYKIPNA